MTKKEVRPYPHGTATRVAKALSFSPEYVRNVLAGKAHNAEIVKKALEIALQIKDDRECSRAMRKRIAFVTLEIHNEINTQATEIVNQTPLPHTHEKVPQPHRRKQNIHFCICQS